MLAAKRGILADARNIVRIGLYDPRRRHGVGVGAERRSWSTCSSIAATTQAAKEFRVKCPATPWRLYVEALGAAYQPVLDGIAGFGIVGSLPIVPSNFTAERLTGVAMVMVAAGEHPLAKYKGTIPKSELAKHVQLVLTDRSSLSKGREFGVMSPSTWRLADLFAKHAFLLNGLGWGGMPMHVVQGDLAAGRLMELRVEDMPSAEMILPMSAVYPTSTPPGPAGRWLIERMKLCSGKQTVA